MKSKPVWLVNGDHDISRKIDGMVIGLKAQFVKKVQRFETASTIIGLLSCFKTASA
jgi:hypothetical protein